MKKVAVLGSTGMAGHVAALYLEEHGYDVYRASRSERNDAKSMRIDVTDFKALKNWFDSVLPDVIVNCIGLLQKTCEERPDRAVLINSYLPKWLENQYKYSNTRLIHLSTDCVFSGKRGNYLEDDLPDGRTMYDRSKALGEINNAKDLTFRMSIVGPDIDPNGTGLLNWFLKQDGEIGGYHKAIWSGITTIELARGINQAIQSGLSGLYQLVPEKAIDKYHLLLLLQKAFHRDNVTITPNDSVVVDKSQVNTRRDFDFTVQDYPKQVSDMAEWVKNHKELYRHYPIDENCMVRK